MKISKSKLNVYKKCPREFKYIYIDGMESEPNEYMQLGLDVHKIAEKTGKELMQKKNFTKQDVESALSNSIIKSNFDLTNHIDALYYFFINLSKDHYRILSVEDDIYNESQNIHGIVDLVLEDVNTGNLVIVDYKTGKSKPITNFRLELCIYRFLVESKYNGRTVSSAIIFFTKDKKYRGFNFINNQKKGAYVTDEDYQTIFPYISFIRHQINNNIFPPKKQFLCKYCNFQEQCNKDGGF